jgi:hypothetical protein
MNVFWAHMRIPRSRTANSHAQLRSRGFTVLERLREGGVARRCENDIQRNKEVAQREVMLIKRCYRLAAII